MQIEVMNATLTIDLDSQVLARAEHEARARRTTLVAIVAKQLEVMAVNWEESQAGRTPITDGLRGVISLPADFDQRETLTDELARKHAS